MTTAPGATSVLQVRTVPSPRAVSCQRYRQMLIPGYVAVRLAYQLSLHKPQARPLPADSLLARAVLNKERTFLHLIIADLYTLRLCEGPYMVPTEHYPKALDWLDDHPHLQSGTHLWLLLCIIEISDSWQTLS